MEVDVIGRLVLLTESRTWKSWGHPTRPRVVCCTGLTVDHILELMYISDSAPRIQRHGCLLLPTARPFRHVIARLHHIPNVSLYTSVQYCRLYCLSRQSPRRQVIQFSLSSYSSHYLRYIYSARFESITASQLCTGKLFQHFYMICLWVTF